MISHFRPAGSTRAHWGWAVLVVALVALRLPSLVQPAGGDQGLYGYAGERILAGDVMYRDMWDQKPPGISFLYALFWRIWPHESVVPAADLAAAATVAGLLILIGRRRYSPAVGYGAAGIFLLFGDPYLQRLSGIYVRGQCEPFIALAVTASLVLLAFAQGRPMWLLASGVLFAAAFWLKYNAAAYGLPIAAAAWAWRHPSGGKLWRDLAWIAAGFSAVVSIVLLYFVAHGVLHDLWLATIEYNLHYSNETYDGSMSMVRYVVTMPFDRVRLDPLWFLGGLGALVLTRLIASEASVVVLLGWLIATVVSIAINGSRGLPNYFVQADPALALAAAAGLASVRTSRLAVRLAVVAVLLVGAWRVGSDSSVAGLRLASLPGLVANVGYDLSYLRGRVDRDAYLRRFSGQKYDAYEISRLVRDLRETTAPADRIFVFGFSGGSVCWLSERASASRFFWSMPVIREFAAGQPGYGTAGLLQDLARTKPTVVALQKEEWRSYDFFMHTAALRNWLESEYRNERETPMFSVWRRKS